jgi:hypothetical protein
MSQGYIYILLNRAFQGNNFKIGMTSKTPQERAREISSATGVPRPFEVLYEQLVVDCEAAERILHMRLHAYRSTKNREFFELPLKTAIKTLEEVADEVGRLEEESSVVQHVGSSGKPPAIGEISATAGSHEAGSRKKESQSARFEDHLGYTDPPRQQILKELRKHVFWLDGGLEQSEQVTAGRRIAYKKPGEKIFLEIKVQRAAIVLHLADGGCLDPNHIADDIPESYGWRQLKKRIAITNMNDFDAATPFIDAAYRAKL